MSNSLQQNRKETIKSAELATAPLLFSACKFPVRIMLCAWRANILGLEGCMKMPSVSVLAQINMKHLSVQETNGHMERSKGNA